MHTWSDNKPVRLVEQQVPADDPAGKAIAWLLRFVQGRPVSAVTCAFLAWLVA